MREIQVVPTGTSYFRVFSNNGSDDVNALGIARPGPNGSGLDITNGVSGTQGHGAVIATNNADAYVAFSAEL